MPNFFVELAPDIEIHPFVPGTFLLRDSSDPCFLYSLTVRTPRGTTSIRIAPCRGCPLATTSPPDGSRVPSGSGVCANCRRARRALAGSTQLPHRVDPPLGCCEDLNKNPTDFLMLPTPLSGNSLAKNQGGSALPGSQGSSTLAGNQGGSTSPGNQGGSTLPGNQRGSTLPGDQGGSTLPGNQGGSTSPGNQGGRAPPPPVALTPRWRAPSQ